METGGFFPNCICTLQECLMQHLNMSYKQVSFLARRQHAVEVSESAEVGWSYPFEGNLTWLWSLGTVSFVLYQIVRVPLQSPLAVNRNWCCKGDKDNQYGDFKKEVKTVRAHMCRQVKQRYMATNAYIPVPKVWVTRKSLSFSCKQRLRYSRNYWGLVG